MIKNTTATILFTTVLFSLPLVVLAENATTSGIRGKLLNRIEEIEPKIELRLASTTRKIEDSKMRLENRLGSTTNRIEDQRERLENRLGSTTNRIEERKGKLDERRKENVRRLGSFMTKRFGATINTLE
jgi:peptidoglycan hydrolase CwlO-like protein